MFKHDEEEFKNFFLPSGMQYGLIAQDVEKILPQFVENTTSGYKIVKYEKFVPHPDSSSKRAARTNRKT